MGSRKVPDATVGLAGIVCAFSFTLFAQTPVIPEGEVRNGASFARGQPVSPGSIASIFGSELASSLQQAGSVPLPTTLADTSVTVNNIPAPLYFVSAGQINVQIPWDSLPQGADSGSAAVVVRRGSTSSQPRTVQLASAAPGIFTILVGDKLLAVVYDAFTGVLAQAEGSIAGLTTQPTQAGKVLSILATGLGPVNPPARDGRDSRDALRTTVATPTVLIGGREPQVLFSGLAADFPGVNQINLVVPDGVPAGSAVPLQIRMGSITTTDAAIMAIR